MVGQSFDVSGDVLNVVPSARDTSPEIPLASRPFAMGTEFFEFFCELLLSGYGGTSESVADCIHD